MNPLRAALTYYRLRTSWLGDGGQPVALSLAQQRTDVCLRCPQNQPMPLWETLTAPEANRLRRLIALKANMKLAVTGEDGLHTCAVCGCHLATLVWTPQARVAETLRSGDPYPPHCWKFAPL